ncbi:MAG: acyl-ACP--UDP-N-acetylglucosamine O-acyltransferase [Acidobacteria bacterium]|nr:acyl-ACP--UDP-N-acetylglucosamine O-acyltransferase [Acidobacteriota bacterium]MBI3656407.1 acyl-ACP--UDP-N-acetylglucosamine O-acyltransferase [Acidobacteriota bacterium]
MSAHTTAVISSAAELGAGVEVGPYCIIEGRVRIGARTRLLSHVVIYGPAEIGEDCSFYSFCSIGSPPQDLKYKGEPTNLVIGVRNIFRESITINRGTVGGGGVTRVGDDNFFMTLVHIAHDCHVGHHTILGNAATLAGHVHIDDHAILGAYSGVHQFCRVGTHAYVGGYSVLTRDVLPYIKTVGQRNEAGIYGINTVGLARKGFSQSSLEALERAYRILFRSKLNTGDALAMLKSNAASTAEVQTLITFIETCERGFIR